MKKIIILILSLWLSNNYSGQTKWIAHKSHSGKMNTFSLKSPDNLGCKRGDFLELNVSNFDVLGNECTRPIILENGMVIKDPKLDSAGFATSHDEINRLAKMDSTNYYPYKIVYDSVKNVNYAQKEVNKTQVIIPVKEKQELLIVDSPAEKKKEHKKKINTPSLQKTKTSPTNKSDTHKQINASPQGTKTTKKVKKSKLPILPIFVTLLGVLVIILTRKLVTKNNQ
jgi:hypothetical protein